MLSLVLYVFSVLEIQKFILKLSLKLYFYLCFFNQVHLCFHYIFSFNFDTINKCYFSVKFYLEKLNAIKIKILVIFLFYFYKKTNYSIIIHDYIVRVVQS